MEREIVKIESAGARRLSVSYELHCPVQIGASVRSPIICSDKEYRFHGVANVAAIAERYSGTFSTGPTLIFDVDFDIYPEVTFA